MPDLESYIKTCLEARDAYYNSGKPIMSDSEYDALEDLIRSIAPNHPLFENIGHAPSSNWKKCAHRIPMGSLEKVHNKEDFLKWASKFPINTIYCIQKKLDGLSLSVEYDNSKFVRAVTRGDGKEGEDISDNIRLMKGFKENLPNNFTGSLRGEILLFKKDFDQINSTLFGEEKYSNPRNAASGISRKLDGKYCKYLSLCFYDISIDIDEDEKIEYIRRHLELPTILTEKGDLEIVIHCFNGINKERELTPFGIDGIVIKICSKEIQKEAGVINNRPKAQIAWKFDPPGAVTKFIEETWEVGRTGVVTPVAHVEPVEIDGSIIRKVTLHNIAEMRRLKIGRGDTVMIIKAGDVIPKITQVLEHKDDDLTNFIEIPHRCPCCGSILLNDGIKIRCLSDTCDAKNIYRILNWIKVTGIEYFGESVLTALLSKNRLNNISDIYKLKNEDISTLEGWGNSSAEKIISSIEKSRDMKPEIFLEALGMYGISKGTSERLIQKYETLDNLLDKANVEDIKELKDFSDITANNVVNSLKTYRDEINELLSIIKIIYKKKEGKLQGLSFCFTGAMTKPRSEYQKRVDFLGGKNDSSITKSTSYLVSNEDKGSSKSLKALKYGVKVINEEEFLSLL